MTAEYTCWDDAECRDAQPQIFYGGTCFSFLDGLRLQRYSQALSTRSPCVRGEAPHLTNATVRGPQPTPAASKNEFSDRSPRLLSYGCSCGDTGHLETHLHARHEAQRIAAMEGRLSCQHKGWPQMAPPAAHPAPPSPHSSVPGRGAGAPWGIRGFPPMSRAAACLAKDILVEWLSVKGTRQPDFVAGRRDVCVIATTQHSCWQGHILTKEERRGS